MTVDAAASDSCRCLTLEELRELSGPVPFVTFPKVKVVAQTGMLTLDSVAALVQHCQDLQECWVSKADVTHFGNPNGVCMTLPPSEPVAARVAAVKSLAILHKLSVLGLKPCSNEELAAFVEVVQQLQQKQLRRMGVALEPGCTVTAAGVMLLGQLSGLERLDVRDSTSDSVLLDDSGPLLCALKGVQCVRLNVHQDLVSAIEDTVAELSAQGLSVPASLLIDAHLAGGEGGCCGTLPVECATQHPTVPPVHRLHMH